MANHPYLASSEPAVRHLFAGLAEYDSLPLPRILQYVDETGVVRMTKEENEQFLKAYEAHFDLEFSLACLAGSILQIAYLCLKQYSPRPVLNARCLQLGVKERSTAARCCVGRLVKDLPIGLLIYAGRIQYNHWEGGEPENEAAKNVFRELVRAYYDNPYFDMGYVLDYPSPKPVSHHIVRLELRWREYSDYAKDMQAMIENDQRPS